MSLRYAPSKRYAKYVKAAMACGHWRDGAKVTGNDKALLVHIRTGKTVAYGLHDGGSDWNAARNFAKEAGDICGCLFVQPRGRKRSRKADQRTDFDPSRARRENERWRESWGGDVEALHERHDRACRRLDEIKESGLTRAAREEAARLAREVIETEEALARFHQPFTPYGGRA